MAGLSPPVRDRFSQALMDLDRVSTDLIKKAEALQSIHGGGLDTALLELGVLDEAAVLEALARARGAAAVDPLSLREIPAEVLRLLPAKAAQRLRAVPFRAAAASAHLAVLDPSDLSAQDELAFVVGRRVRLFVTTELRLVEALGRHYGSAIPARFRTLLERVPSPLPADDPAAPEEFETGAGEATPFAPRPGEAQALERRRRAAAREVPADSNANAEAADPEAPPTPLSPPAPELPTEPSLGAAPAPPTKQWVVPLSEAERARLRPSKPDRTPTPLPPARATRANPVAVEREAVADQLLRDVLREVDRALLFRVRAGRLEGWRGAGKGVNTERLSAFTAELRSLPGFADLLAGTRFYCGPLAPGPDTERLAAVWGAGQSAGCAILPLRLQGRLGAILYVDRIGRLIGPAEVGRWEASCGRAAGRLEECLLRGKHRQA
jgi:hypothetical protein